MDSIKDYITFEDLIQKLGYKSRYKSKLGSLGRALLESSKNQRSNNTLKRYWDSYFNNQKQLKQLKEQKKNDSKKPNSRPNLQSDAKNNTKRRSSGSFNDNGQDTRR